MPRAQFRRETSEFDRGLSFFDVIYGFALTLLVLNIDVPDREQWESLSRLLRHGLGSQLLGFAISFVVIAALWRTNYRLFARLHAMDLTVIHLGLLTVGLVVFVPFTTQGISNSETADLPLPTAMYAVNLTLIILMQTITFAVARRHGLIIDPEPPRAVWAQRLDAVVPAVVFMASIPVAYWVDADTAKYTWLSLAILGPLSGRRAERITREARAEARGDEA